MKKFLKSFQHAFHGIRFAAAENNFRVQLSIGILVIIAGAIFKLSSVEWLWIVLMTGLVLSAEMVNTSIEGLVDLVSPEFNPLAGKVKDLAAGAVLVISIAACVVGLIIFVPHFITI
jgi:diacylglycerol kinase (ATP)